MRKTFSIQFALIGIQKNKQIYYPYLLAGSCMVMVFYVFAFLGFSEVVRQLPGKNLLPAVFLLATVYIGFFSIPFLIHTNASLIKKRKKEFGLYQTLGMNKKNMMHIMFWETAISYGIVMFLGILFGCIFSRIAELVLIRIMKKEVIGHFMIEWEIIRLSGVAYLCIYILIFLNSLYHICKSRPLAMLQSAMEGERAPKRNSFLALCSVVLILTSYFIMNHCQLTLFSMKFYLMIASITIGTFLLFMFGSVWICQFLQRRKKFYYQTSHFVPVSFMAFRMKRNGAGLGAICILITVILSSFAGSLALYETVRNLMIDKYSFTAEISEKLVSVRGAILFMAINFNLMFMIVISLIMYYKQLSDGYEDKSRFELLKKVGMTQEEIKAGIRTQMRIVFSLPLFVGTIHFLFMKKMFYEIFQEMAEIEMADIRRSMLISYFIFICYYVIVYGITARKYLKLVESAKM